MTIMRLLYKEDSNRILHCDIAHFMNLLTLLVHQLLKPIRKRAYILAADNLSQFLIKEAKGGWWRGGKEKTGRGRRNY